MRIYAIDPGNKESGVVGFACETSRVVHPRVVENHELLKMIRWSGNGLGDYLCIEMMKARGMPVSNDEMETLVWIGRFMQAWPQPHEVKLAYRADIKLHICGSAKAKDANVRQALIDRIGKPGTKKNQGPTFGVTSHAWPALAVAVYAADHRGKEDAFASFANQRPALRSRTRL